MKNLLKICLVIMMSIMIAGCSSSTNEEELKVNILCPTGAPALAFVSEYDHITKNGKIDFVDGSDLLMTELVKEDSEYDIIVAPINIGAKLLETNQTDYKMVAVLTWGNLYVVGTSEDVLKQQGEIALFGQGAVPEKIYENVQDDMTLTPVFYNSATLVQQQLLSQKVQAGLLAEPAATATIAKAKQSGIELKIIKDLQADFNDGQGYPQAAIFMKDDVKCDSLLEGIDEFTNNGYSDLEKYLTKIGIETLNLPSVELTVKSIDRQNLHYKKAVDCQDEISDFLSKFNIQFTKEMLHD